MPIITIIYAVLLIALGSVAYFGSGGASITALIPSFFGAVFLSLGVAGVKGGSVRKHAMHGAAGLALLALFGTFGGVVAVLKMIGGTEPERAAAAVTQAVMFAMTIAYLVFSIRSFIQARRARKAA